MDAALDTAHLRALGTIGGGNHFAELQCIDTVIDAAQVAQAGLAPACLQLLVHSGSRSMGPALLRAHVDALSRTQPARDRCACFSACGAKVSRCRT